MQRADRAVAGKMAVELPRFGNGAARVQRGPGPDDGFPLLDPSEAVADQILGSEIAGRDSNISSTTISRPGSRTAAA